MKYIIFDIDGTLSDTTQVDDTCYISAFESTFGASIKDVNWSDIKHVTDRGIVEEMVLKIFNREVNSEEIDRMRKKFFQQISDEFKRDKSQFTEIPGAVIFFNNAEIDPNYEVGIATGGWEETADFKLKTIGINPHTVCYSNSSHFKTRENITLDVINQLEMKSHQPAEEIIYFGDGKWDYITCQNLGIRFIGIDHKTTKQLEKIGAEEVHTDFSDLVNIMKSIA